MGEAEARRSQQRAPRSSFRLELGSGDQTFFTELGSRFQCLLQAGGIHIFCRGVAGGAERLHWGVDPSINLPTAISKVISLGKAQYRASGGRADHA
jgi:hypothetical protein